MGQADLRVRACLLLLVFFFICSACTCAASRAEAATVIELPETAALPGVVLYPARANEPRPLTIVLHGKCDKAINLCSYFANEVTAHENLICPRASQPCAGGGASWAKTGFMEAITAAVERAKAALPVPANEERGRTLIGYSQGAYRALELAQQTPGTYPRVMLIGAQISLDFARLDEHGVTRLLLGAGHFDMMHDVMQREAIRAEDVGFAARFLDLGRMGHALTPSFVEFLPGALTWLRAS